METTKPYIIYKTGGKVLTVDASMPIHNKTKAMKKAKELSLKNSTVVLLHLWKTPIFVMFGRVYRGKDITLISRNW